MYIFIDNRASLAAAMEELRNSSVIALDIECASGLHHYVQRVCLIQIASQDGIYIIDPLARLDLAPIGSILEDAGVEIVIHDAGFDMRSMERDFGWRLNNIFDTLIAARLCGHRPFGLSAMLEKYFGIVGSKRFQKADWAIRPLTKDMLRYAAGDVSHLIELRNRLAEELSKVGRMEWAHRKFLECESIRYEPDTRPLFVKVKGAKNACDRRELAVLREIVEVREKFSQDLNLPPFRLCSDETLIELAKFPPANLSELKAKKGIHPFLKGQGAEMMLSALSRGAHKAPLAWPVPAAKGRKRNIDEVLLTKLKVWRADIAAKNDLDADLLLSMDSMRSIASGKDVEEAIGDGAVRGWQGVDVILSLKAVLSDYRSEKGDGEKRCDV